VFQLETRKLDIEEGETKELKVWALPRESKEYKNNLVLCVENNPVPIQYMMKCWGVDPTIDIDGPWGTHMNMMYLFIATSWLMRCDINRCWASKS
jgi:hypothetical protein